MADKQKTKIFIVEDNAALCDGYFSMIIGLGYDCRESSGFPDPVEDIVHYEPRLALMDTQLQFTTGLDICERLRKTEYGKKMGIVGMSSGYYEKKWIQAGADAFVHKSDINIVEGLSLPPSAKFLNVLDNVLEKYQKK